MHGPTNLPDPVDGVYRLTSMIELIPEKEQLYRELLPILGEVALIGEAYSWLISDVRDIMRGGVGIERPTSSSFMIVDRRLINALWVRYRLTRSAENELQILRSDLTDVLALLGR